MRTDFRFTATAYTGNPRYVGHEFTQQRPKSIKAMAKKFLAYRAAKREALEPVDAYCRRGEHAARFAYFD